MLFRARIALVAALVVLGGTVLTATIAQSTLKKDARDQVEGQVTAAQEAFGALERMRGFEVTTEAIRFGREDESGSVFDRTGDAQRSAAFAAVEVFNARLGRDEQRADIVAILGANGHVVSRDLNMGVLYDMDLKAKYKAVGIALAGTAIKDLWLFDGRMYRVALAPIRAKTGVIVGALLIGYVTSAKDAAADKKKLGTDVVYFMDGKIQASSFSKGGSESAEEKDIATKIFAPGGPADDAAVGSNLTKNFELTVGGVPYVAAAGPLPGNLTQSKSGFVVLARAQDGDVAKIVSLFYALGALGFLAAIGAAVGTALRFVGPLDDLETGVTEVINGKHDHTFESSSPDFEGFANGLNVMVARLTGRPDPTDEDHGGGDSGRTSAPAPAWQNEVAVDSSPAIAPQLSPENARIAAEPEDVYFKRTFDEYMASRRQHDEPTEGYTLESFTAKLKASEAQQVQKANVARVRFKVVLKDGATTLKPIHIPK